MSVQSFLRMSSFRTYILVLCFLYLLMVLMFHSDLQQPRGNPKHSAINLINSIKYEGDGAAFGKGDNVPNNIDIGQIKALGDLVKNVNNGDFNPIKSTPKTSKRYKSSTNPPTAFVQPRHYHTNGKCVGTDDGSENEFVEIIQDMMFVYSAYWDHRPNDFDNTANGSYIRMIGAFKTRGQGRPDIWCNFQTESGGENLESKIYFYEMCENHGRPYGGYILSCSVPDQILQRPCSVKVRHNDNLSEKAISVCSIDPEPTRNKFGICVPPLFGDVNTKKLVEFVELSKLLGANVITFYNFDVSEDALKILEHYKNQGTVSIVPWNYPSALDISSWYHGQSLAIQDCLYRNMHSTEFLMFNDIDEFMVPHVHQNWNELVASTFQPTYCALQFHSAFFEKDYQSIQNQTFQTDLFTLNALKRTSSFSKVRTKCMVKPYLIFEKGIHHISKPIWANLEVTRMPEKLAYLHHYRACMRDFGMNCHNYEEDLFLMKYRSALESNIQNIQETLDLTD